MDTLPEPVFAGPRWARIAPLLLAVLLAGARPAAAQDDAGSSATPPPADAVHSPEPGVQSGDGAIEVESPPADVKIQRRLTRILASTERVQDLTLRVRDGVVTVGGITSTDEHRDWVANLVLRTDGVVALVNELRAREASIWDVRPALQELRLLAEQVVRAAPRTLLAVVLFVSLLLAARRTAGLLTRLLFRRNDNRILRLVVERGILILLIVLAAFVFLRVSGLTRLAFTVVGGTGVLGLVLGLAFRDIAENFLASLLISVQRPFRIGDTVEIEGYTGVVQKVTMRGTVLMDFEGNHVQLANATVYKATIRNFTANPKTRVDFGIGVGYDSGIARAQEVIGAVLQQHSAVLADPAPAVLVERFGPSTADLCVQLWIDGRALSKPKVRSSVMRAVLDGLVQAGVSLPDEAREVVFPSDVPVRLLRGDEEEPRPAAARPTLVPEPSAPTAGAEGDLASEVGELQRQARASESPEQGADLLGQTSATGR